MLAPLNWRQISPAQATRNDIFTRVLQHIEKRIIGLKNLAVEIPQTNSNDVRIHQPPDLCVAVLKLMIEGVIAMKASRQPPSMSVAFRPLHVTDMALSKVGTVVQEI